MNDSQLKEILNHYKTIAVYGLSPDKTKASHRVAQYMQNQSFEIQGIYPKPVADSPFTMYTSLQEVPLEKRKFLDVFRGSDKIPALVEEVLAVGGVEVLWLQEGITHPEAESKARNAGITVLSDLCLKKEHERLF